MIVTCKAVPRSTLIAYQNHDEGARELADLARAHDRVWVVAYDDPTTPVLGAGRHDLLVLDGGALAQDALAMRRAIEFILAAHADGPHATITHDLLVVACDRGIHRSGTIVTWAAEHLGLDVASLRLHNPQIDPDPCLLRWLRFTHVSLKSGGT